MNEEQVYVIQKNEVHEMGGRGLIKQISKLAAWPNRKPRFVYGILLPEYQAVVFNLLDTHPVSER